MEQVSGDRLTTTLSSLTPQTTYYYKLQARNTKGHSPFTSVSNFTTLPASAATSSPSSQAGVGGGLFEKKSTIIIIVLSVFGAMLLIGLVGAFFGFFYCRKKPPTEQTPRNTG